MSLKSGWTKQFALFETKKIWKKKCGKNLNLFTSVPSYHSKRAWNSCSRIYYRCSVSIASLQMSFGLNICAVSFRVFQTMHFTQHWVSFLCTHCRSRSIDKTICFHLAFNAAIFAAPFPSNTLHVFWRSESE